AGTAVAAYQLVSLIRLRPLLYPPPRRLKRVHARLRRAIAARGRDKDTFISLSGPTRTLRLDFLRRKIDVVCMRRLMLLRHAKSDRPQPDMRDHDRPLAARGETAAAQIGAYMARHDLLPDGVLCSTAVRTCETWRLVANTLPKPILTVYEARLYEAATN